MNNYAIITVYHMAGIFTSLPLPMVEGGSETQLIYKLTEEGSEGINMIKFPISETSFIILSKTQLADSIIEVEIFDSTSKPKKKSKKNSEMINS